MSTLERAIEIATHLQRKPSAITSRIKKLELAEKYGER